MGKDFERLCIDGKLIRNIIPRSIITDAGIENSFNRASYFRIPLYFIRKTARNNQPSSG